MTIKTMTVLLGALLLGIFGAVSWSLIEYSDLLEYEASELAKAGESVHIAEEIKSRLLIHNRNAFLYLLQNDPTRRESGELQRDEISALLERAGRLVNGRAEIAVLHELKEDVEAYLRKRDEIESGAESPVEKYGLASRYVEETVATLDRLIEINREQMDRLVKGVHRQNAAADRMAVILFCLAGVVLLSIIIVVFTALVRPLSSIARSISQYGSGQVHVRARATGLREVRAIGANFNSMADSLEGKRQDQLRFIASIAHDLKNPLSAMSIASSLLVTQGREDERELSAIIARQVGNLDRLVSDLLDTTRIEAGHLDLDLSEQDVRSLIESAVELHRTGRDLHRFQMELPDGPLVCRCDGGRVSQVINNIVSNAIKYSPNGGLVTVRARRERGRLEIAITDQGIGIHGDDLENVFKPFHRTSSTKDTIPGIGLGLSSSRRIIEAHGGTLEVESTPGRGSTFRVTIPTGETGSAPGDRGPE